MILRETLLTNSANKLIIHGLESYDWQGQKKKTFKSKKTAFVSWVRLIAANQVSHTLIKAVWQECRWRKPDWKGWKRLQSSMNCVRRWWTSLSRGVVKIERRETGLKLLGSVRSLVLGTGITVAAFRAGGKLFCSMHKLRYESKISQRMEE